MHLVDAHRLGVRLALRPGRHPLLVAPLVRRTRRRPTPWPAGPRCGRPSGRPSPASGRPGRGRGTCSGCRRRCRARTAPTRPVLPSTRIGCAQPDQPSKSPVTRTPCAVGAHTAKLVPVTGPGGRVVAAHVRAEHVPQPLVAALADQVQVDLAERGQPAVRVVDDVDALAVAHGEPVVRGRPGHDPGEQAGVVHPDQRERRPRPRARRAPRRRAGAAPARRCRPGAGARRAPSAGRGARRRAAGRSCAGPAGTGRSGR